MKRSLVAVAFCAIASAGTAQTIEDLKDFCQGRVHVSASSSGGTVTYSDGRVDANGSSITITRSGATIDQLDFGEVGYLGCVERLGRAFGLTNLAINELNVVCEPDQPYIDYVEFYLDGVAVDPSFMDVNGFIDSIVQTSRTFYLDNLGYAYVRDINGRFRRYESENKFNADMQRLRQTGYTDFSGIVVDYEEADLQSSAFFFPGVRSGFFQSLTFVDPSLSTRFALAVDMTSDQGENAVGWLEGYLGFCYVP